MKSQVKSSKKHSRKPTKSGFTIIEVSLVTAFMAMLMIAIATVTTSISALYRKGITLKAVNSVGRNIVSELTTSINAAPSIDSLSLCYSLLPSDANNRESEAQRQCIADNAYKFIYQSWEGPFKDEATGIEGPVQYGGVLCTGDYSYVWNTYYGQEKEKLYSVTYWDGEKTDTKEGFKLLRFTDKTYLACSTNISKTSYTVEDRHNIDITELRNGAKNKVTDFQDNYLEISDIALDLYELTIFPVSQDSVTLRSYFSGTFILATVRGDVNIVRGGDYCNVDDYSYQGANPTASNLLDLGSEFNYCGINKFNFAARTAGSGV